MNKNEKLQRIEDAVKAALAQFCSDNVDIIKNEDSGMVYIMYHSRHNSFPIIGNVCTSYGLSESDISDIADYYDVGYCW